MIRSAQSSFAKRHGTGKQGKQLMAILNENGGSIPCNGYFDQPERTQLPETHGDTQSTENQIGTKAEVA